MQQGRTLFKNTTSYACQSFRTQSTFCASSAMLTFLANCNVVFHLNTNLSGCREGPSPFTSESHSFLHY